MEAFHLFHKQFHSLSKNMAHKKPKIKRKTAVILCEGKKSEPEYLKAFARLHGITTLTIPENHKTDAKKLVLDAMKRLKKRDAPDFVIVVVDHDGKDAIFNDAFNEAKNNKHYGKKLFFTPSYPCFETWLLFHYEYTTGPLNNKEALKKVKKHNPNYDKTSALIMDDIVELYEEAIKNSKKVSEHLEGLQTLNPSTEMHELVELLLLL